MGKLMVKTFVRIFTVRSSNSRVSAFSSYCASLKYSIRELRLISFIH